MTMHRAGGFIVYAWMEASNSQWGKHRIMSE